MSHENTEGRIRFKKLAADSPINKQYKTSVQSVTSVASMTVAAGTGAETGARRKRVGTGVAAAAVAAAAATTTTTAAATRRTIRARAAYHCTLANQVREKKH
jgi:hypothetical protein